MKKSISRLLLISAIIFTAAMPFSAQARLKTTLDGYIKKFLKANSVEERVSENKDARKIVYGDLNGDGKADAAVFFVVLLDDRNSWEYHLAAFTNKNGGYKFADDAVVGGRFTGEYTLKSIKNRAILGVIECSENQTGCGEENSKNNRNLKLVRGKLVE